MTDTPVAPVVSDPAPSTPVAVLPADPVVPVSRKVLVGLAVAAVGAVLPLVGVYEVPAYLQGFISSAEYAAAAFLVTEQEKYLLPALAKVRQVAAAGKL